jgi:hypothetical protein
MTETDHTPAASAEDASPDFGHNVAVALIAAFLLGPFGMFYSTRVGAIVMIVVTVLVALPTLGFGIVLTLPICMVWAAIAAVRSEPRAALHAG